MTFSYVGYIWAISGCACFAFFLVGIAAALHLIGRRTDRGGPTPSVESVPLRDAPRADRGADGPASRDPGPGRGPGTDGDAS